MLIIADGDPDFRRSAFIFYAVDHWLERVVENPGCTRYEVMKELRKEWNQLSDKKKKPYTEVYVFRGQKMLDFIKEQIEADTK